MIRVLFTRRTIVAIVCVLLFFTEKGYSQFQTNEIPPSYDRSMRRLLVLTTGHYINGISQGQLDMDSSILLACRIYRLGRLLPYKEGYNDGQISAGSQLIESGKIAEAKTLLGHSDGENQLELLTDLGNYYLHKSGNVKSDLDSARFFIEQVNALSISPSLQKWKNESLIVLGQIHFQNGNFSESKKHFDEVVRVTRQNGDAATLARALHIYGVCHPFDDPSRLSVLEESRTLCQKHNLKVTEIEVHAQMVSEYFRTNPNLAEQELLHGVELESAIGYHHIQYIHNVLAYIYLHRSDYVKAMYHAEQSIKHMEMTKDVALSPLYFQRMTEVSSSIGRQKDAEYWNGRAMSVPKSNETKIFWYKSFFQRIQYVGISNGYAAAMKFINETATAFPPGNALDQMYLTFIKGETFEKLKQPKEAEREYVQFTSMAERFPPQFVYVEMPSAYANISHFYFTQGEYIKSRTYANKALEIAKQRGSVVNLKWSYYMLFELDSVSNNYLGAIQNYQRYKDFSDSAFNLDQRNKLTELEVQYESVKKDQDIKLLTQKNEQASLVRNVTFVGVGLLLAMLGLLYHLYNSKLRINEQLESQQKQIGEKNKKLENLLDEKEWLVKEIHHRVKNNLHTIVSLLESQSAFLGNDALAAVRDSQHRVYAMSLIHQKLYLSDNITTVDMSVYVQELVNYLCDSFNTGQRIRFQVQVAPVSLDVATAIPLGLILNEAITNSIKYAFPESIGVIDISLVQANDQLILKITDNGIGLPADFDKLKNSLGMRLMKGLSKEIDAAFSIETKGGTSISITFRDPSVFRPQRKVDSNERMEAFA